MSAAPRHFTSPSAASEPLPCYIDGKPYKTSSTFEVLDPNDNTKVLRKVYGASADEARMAVEAAAKAFPGWKATSIYERRSIFLKAAEIARSRIAEFAQIQVDETTISKTFSEWTAVATANMFIGAGSAAQSALAGSTAATEFPGQTALVTREPYGVVLGITPWNAPFALAARAVIYPIIAGNTAVLKTSELSPLSNILVAEVFEEAGLPKGVLNVVHASREDTPKVLESIIANPIIRHVNFTGSTRVGSIIGSLCGKYIKPSVLELGGAGVLIVLEDADIERAAKCAVYGGFLHSGQVCMATNNVLVHESIAAEFVSAIQRVMKDTRAGSGTDIESNKLRGVFTDAHADRTRGLVRDAVSKGAKLIVGDEQELVAATKGNVVQPLIVDDVKDGMEIATEEIFGPALGIIHFSSSSQAIQLTNSLSYGLNGAVHSRSLSRALAVARALEVNQVHINSVTLHDSEVTPFGGWKGSGYGRFNGIEGVREFTQTKSVTYVDVDVAPVPML